MSSKVCDVFQKPVTREANLIRAWVITGANLIKCAHLCF
ncbi:hypothetical protein PAMC26510_18785 [Caballeronia sordidicola]|uniref:Uncharacterized protein n=1 Tax=Caballeronia sordidicola TaxID=196367 RepID=A0A242MQ65_CABSO|nr:hypothetical protein PAMC26510_18785 [Caballeronia sordidicola]OTP73522.1 hypothetical protein PAMC26577_17775 [Caballeronia sordidicola]